LPPSARDDDALTFQLAGDGRVSTLRTLLRQLDDAQVGAEARTVHTLDLAESGPGYGTRLSRMEDRRE